MTITEKHSSSIVIALHLSTIGLQAKSSLSVVAVKNFYCKCSSTQQIYLRIFGGPKYKCCISLV